MCQTQTCKLKQNHLPLRTRSYIFYCFSGVSLSMPIPITNSALRVILTHNSQVVIHCSNQLVKCENYQFAKVINL